MQSAAAVFGLLMIPTDQTVLMIKRRDFKWYLPGGRVEPGGDERQQLEHHVKAQTGFSVNVIEMVGGKYGGPFRAYDCQCTDQDRLGDPDVIDMEYVTIEKIRAMDVADALQRRMALDALTIMQPPDVIGDIDAQYQEFAPIAGVFVPDDEFTLVEVAADEQRTWRRLDMTAI